jgi:replication factor A1
MADNQYQCERCNMAYPDCLRRYVFSMTLVDNTSTTWASAFDEQGQKLLGKTADEMNKLLEAGEHSQFNAVFDKMQNTDWIFKCKVKAETVGDEQRVKATIQDMREIDYVAETRSMCSALRAL